MKFKTELEAQRLSKSIKTKTKWYCIFSVNFENDPFTYHGETEYPLNIFQNCEPYAESMTAFVKSDLVDSMRKWGYTPEDLTAVCFYFL